ncbi:MAG: hypothetical protein ACXV5U_11155 [Ilumatobacteraceae bacterium]
MAIDLTAAHQFLTSHARLLDRRRFGHVVAKGDPTGLLAAVDAYRNPDGGYGWGLEADLRHASSQPGAALHAFEVFAEIGPDTTERSRRLCDWLGACALDDGGLPFALAINDPTGCSPWWVDADPTVSSAQITTAVTWAALRVARHDPEVATHRWLARSVAYCLAAVARLGDEPHAYEVSFGLRFADAAHAIGLTGIETVERLTRYLPADAVLPVVGGTPDERLFALDVSPDPTSASRAFISPTVIEADLRRLAGLQRPDGGWTVDFASASPVAALEWRGYATVNAVRVILAHTETG